MTTIDLPGCMRPALYTVVISILQLMTQQAKYQPYSCFEA